MNHTLDSILLPHKDCPQASLLRVFAGPNGLVRCKILDLSHPWYIHLLVAYGTEKKKQVELSLPHAAVAWILRGVTDKTMGFFQAAQKNPQSE